MKIFKGFGLFKRYKSPFFNALLKGFVLVGCWCKIG
ncbi:hypothetical protein L931_01595 [Helicobacter pylori PZ5024]|uniref:Uncharacterized protein n=1 Tax=Helicobacter pylori PZ5024 TaxID=1337391 RepID=T2T050_HELPX|nr:hypothetical protein L931_01595 [Helicobacter pylori PZ5024]EQD98665.1 hypothetical protein L930_04755 [Helicobacter pylori PZ5004]